MIITVLLTVIILILGAISSAFWDTSVLPLGIDSAVETLSGWLHYVLDNNWPFQIIFSVVLYYIGWRVILLIIKLFLGNRSPVE